MLFRSLYPGLKGSEDHARAREVLANGVWRDLEKRKGWEQDGIPFGGVLSFRVKGGAAEGAKLRFPCEGPAADAAPVPQRSASS